jgi:hypothetical protein
LTRTGAGRGRLAPVMKKATWIACEEEEKREKEEREGEEVTRRFKLRPFTLTGLARLSRVVYSGMTGRHAACMTEVYMVPHRHSVTRHRAEPRQYT